MLPSSGPLRVATGGVDIHVRLHPAAHRAGVEGVVETADGTRVLKIRVTEPPEDGKANAALIKLLARTWKVPKSALSIISGRTRYPDQLEGSDWEYGGYRKGA